MQNNKKKGIIIILIVCILIMIIVAFLITHNLRKPNDSNSAPKEENTISSTNILENNDSDNYSNELSKNENISDKINKIVQEYCSENGVEVSMNSYLMEDLIELYNSNPNEFNKENVGEYLVSQGYIVSGTFQNTNDNGEIQMPDLVGMTYKEARDYLSTNGYYFISNIKCTYKEEFDNIHIPTKILSTIPSAGTILDPYTDTSITVLADYNYGVQSVEINFNDDEIENKYFGKTLKVQLGSDENSVIEGVVGKDFKIKSKSSKSILTYTNNTKGVKYVDLVDQHKIAYILDEDLIRIKDGITYHYVDGKVYIDNQLIKNIRFQYGAGSSIRGSI